MNVMIETCKWTSSTLQLINSTWNRCTRHGSRGASIIQTNGDLTLSPQHVQSREDGASVTSKDRRVAPEGG